MRPLVHDPTKTVSTAISRRGVPASRPMYSSALRAATLSLSSANDSGSGTELLSGRPWPGFVPHVTNGVSAEASRWTSASKTASSSECSWLQEATAASQSAPVGACGRPCT